MAYQNPEIIRLIHLAEEAAANQPDLMAVVVHAVEQANAADADPYILLGVLVESLVQTLNRMPGPARQIAANATLSFLLARLRRNERR